MLMFLHNLSLIFAEAFKYSCIVLFEWAYFVTFYKWCRRKLLCRTVKMNILYNMYSERVLDQLSSTIVITVPEIGAKC